MIWLAMVFFSGRIGDGMDDFSDWVFVRNFIAYDASFLIKGIDPSNNTTNINANHIIERMKDDYKHAIDNFTFELIIEPSLNNGSFKSEDYDWHKHEIIDRKITLFSIEMDNLKNKFDYGDEISIIDWLNSTESEFKHQRFSREELSRWIADNNLVSKYEFTQKQYTKVIDDQPIYTEIDPSELPLELDIANVAFRAIFNGYGDKSDTFKKRLLDYLQNYHPHLTQEAIQRIATVANHDKTVGRKKTTSK